jgi:hypothetical protein
MSSNILSRLRGQVGKNPQGQLNADLPDDNQTTNSKTKLRLHKDLNLSKKLESEPS